jgi:hypothetical protein
VKVLEIKEQPDGSAIIEVEMTNEEKDMLIEAGFLSLLMKGMVAHENDIRTPISK